MTALAVLAQIAFAAACPPLMLWPVSLVSPSAFGRPRSRKWFLTWATVALSASLLAFLTGVSWEFPAGGAASAAVAVWLWLRSRGPRKRTARKWLGEKSRAVLAAVVAKWREAGARPVPEGVPG